MLQGVKILQVFLHVEAFLQDTHKNINQLPKWKHVRANFQVLGASEFFQIPNLKFFFAYGSRLTVNVSAQEDTYVEWYK